MSVNSDLKLEAKPFFANVHNSFSAASKIDSTLKKTIYVIKAIVLIPIRIIQDIFYHSMQLKNNFFNRNVVEKAKEPNSNVEPDANVEPKNQLMEKFFSATEVVKGKMLKVLKTSKNFAERNKATIIKTSLIGIGITSLLTLGYYGAPLLRGWLSTKTEDSLKYIGQLSEITEKTTDSDVIILQPSNPVAVTETSSYISENQLFALAFLTAATCVGVVKYLNRTNSIFNFFASKNESSKSVIPDSALSTSHSGKKTSPKSEQNNPSQAIPLGTGRLSTSKQTNSSPTVPLAADRSSTSEPRADSSTSPVTFFEFIAEKENQPQEVESNSGSQPTPENKKKILEIAEVIRETTSKNGDNS